MTHEELRDKAYIIATVNNLSEGFTYAEFQMIDARKYTKERPIKNVEKRIVELAYDIIVMFEGEV